MCVCVCVCVCVWCVCVGVGVIVCWSSDRIRTVLITDLPEIKTLIHGLVEVLLYVHRNRMFIRDGCPGRPPRLSHTS